MAKVLTDEKYYTEIADAIREKNGETTQYKPSEMGAAIVAIETGSGGGTVDLPEEAFNITGDCDYWDYLGKWDWFIEQFGNKIITSNIRHTQSMFCGSDLHRIPFEINYSNEQANLTRMFASCDLLYSIPKFNGNPIVQALNGMFDMCHNLKEIPDDFVDWFDWSYSGSVNFKDMFTYCYSLRKIPIELFGKEKTNTSMYQHYLYGAGFAHMYALDELVNLPFNSTTPLTSNTFGQFMFKECGRLKNLTFALQDDGTPMVKQWKNTTIDLNGHCGYVEEDSRITGYNSGLTTATKVVNTETYNALKNNPDYWTNDVTYSRYNHDSAVATINSLPDTSAYLATNGGTNTIKFRGVSGSKTDGGAINTMTDAEIAVATAKGWTITFA